MKGERVAVVVDGHRYEGTVTGSAYTVKGGEPVVAVALDDELPDGRERYLVALGETQSL